MVSFGCLVSIFIIDLWPEKLMVPVLNCYYYMKKPCP